MRLCKYLILHQSFTQHLCWGFPGGSDCKDSTCNARDPGLFPGSGRSPREGIDYPLQYSCLEDNGQRSLVGPVHGVAESDETE